MNGTMSPAARQKAMAALVRVLLAVIAMCGMAVSAAAHEVRPAYLELREEKPGEFEVLFKTPMRGDARLSLAPSFSGKVAELTPMVSRPTGDAMVQTWRISATEPLAGQTVLIDGLARTMTDALVRIEFADGRSWIARLRPDAPEAEVPAAQGKLAVFATYLRQGVEHIAFGFDHLLFVAALMLIVRGWRRLVATVTAFTVAHSITLTAATFGWVTLPSAPVEALIALSIVLVATEIVRMERGRSSLTIARPWIVAFAFGLLHGFGFAGALTELGLPQGDVPLALLAFNAGVELGQLAFIGAVIAAVHLLRRIHAVPRFSVQTAAYAIGIVAAFWCIERFEAVFT